MKTRSMFTMLVASASFAAAGLSGWLLLGLIQPSTEAAVSVLQSPPQQMADPLGASLTRLGLRPENMAAAGVTSAVQVQTILNAVKTQLTQSPNALMLADQSVGAARSAVIETTHLVESGKASGEDLQTLSALRSSLESATMSRDQLVASLLDVAETNMNEAQTTALTTIRLNRANWEMPVEFLVTNRAESDWLLIREALAAERINTARGEPVPQEIQSLLTSLRSDAAVATARANLDSSLQTVTSTWNQVVAP